MKVYFRIIRTCVESEAYILKLQAIMDKCSYLSVAKINSAPYWKDASLIVIELCIAAEEPLELEVWKSLFSEIAGSCTISADSSFVDLAHYETLDTLKAYPHAVFFELHIPLSLVKR